MPQTKTSILINDRYQKLPENFFDIIRRRKLNLSECFLAIYFRGKGQRYGNPFYLDNKTICLELNISEKVFRKYRNPLQEKGVIKFNTGNGKNHLTIYTMLDTIMVPQRVPKLDIKGSQTGTLICQNGNPSLYTNNDTNNDKNRIRDFTIPKNWKENTLEVIQNATGRE